MKMDIKWHKDCLANARAYCEREKETLSRQQSTVDKAVWNCNHLAAQIKEAERKGKDGFDSELFMKCVNPY